MWFDIKDENDVWRIGYCQRPLEKIKKVALDGYHPSHSALYCDHSGKISPIRSETMGLTIEGSKAVRSVVTEEQIRNSASRLSLYLMMSGVLDIRSEDIKTYIRTQFLVLIDKIINTSFSIISMFKMLELQINKFFLNILTFYLRILEASKKYIPQYGTNEVAKHLLTATYELAIMVDLIIGTNPRSKAFFNSKSNLSIKAEGFIDFFIQSGGIVAFKLPFKSAASIAEIDETVLKIMLKNVELFLNICNKVGTQAYNSQAASVLDEIINFLKTVADKNADLKKILSLDVQLMTRIETLYLKLKPNRLCPLKKYLKEEPKSILISLDSKSKLKEAVESERIYKLEERLKKLEQLIPDLSAISSEKVMQVVDRPIPTQNLSEQVFLGSLEFALQSGDVETCKKLVRWRKSLIRLGRITGWQTALAVGMKTYKKCEITHTDIIEANYEYVMSQTK